MLTEGQIDEYRTSGYVVVPGEASADDLGRIRAEVARLYACDHPGRVLETDGVTVRGIHGCHLESEVFARLVRMPALLGAAEAVLGSKVYVHQSKVNAKRALHGDAWPWHQDYIFWEREDGLPEPRLTNVVLFLDEATDFNGPLLFLPGSHRLGTVPAQRRSDPGAATPGGDGDGWRAHLAADLDYALPLERLVELVGRFGMRAATGPAGSLLLFDPRLVHGSGSNMSPFDRQLAIVSYNSVDNLAGEHRGQRPEFLSATETTPLSVWDGGL
jgi:ectoine hydroxylase-related dioxygenase (phytanoyl-CoA dioxygenase family)